MLITYNEFDAKYRDKSLGKTGRKKTQLVKRKDENNMEILAELKKVMMARENWQKLIPQIKYFSDPNTYAQVSKRL